jgi:nucleoredoxin
MEKQFNISNLGSKFVSNSGEVDNSSLKSAKIIAIYFSAHWCPPCRGFTPSLAKFYNEVNKDEKIFEIIFVTSDKDEKSFQGYLSEMPWIAIPFGDSKIKDAKTAFNVSGIPYLVILKNDGAIISTNGRGDVTKELNNPMNAINNWLNK